MNRLAQQSYFAGLSPQDPALGNQRLLTHPRVQQRLAKALGLVGRRGGHTTMRQLNGLVAYLLTGGASFDQRLASQGSQDFHYYELAYRARTGRIFDEISALFDPATVGDPAIDEHLWRGQLADGWIFSALLAAERFA